MLLDRLGPRARPSERPKGFQRWQSLLFMHWRVPVEAIRPLVPASLELDLFEGQAFIGLVPFAMKGVRPSWSPKRLAFDFLETNVRTYVHRKGQPGVYFLSLDAASRIAVGIARAFWGLPYFFAQMELSQQGSETICRSNRGAKGASLDVTYRIGEALPASHPDSLEFFFLERYLLFVERGSVCYSGQVHHVPYPAYRAEVVSLKDELLNQAGVAVAGLPDYAHYSPGVDVEVFGLKRT